MFTSDCWPLPELKMESDILKAFLKRRFLWKSSCFQVSNFAQLWFIIQLVPFCCWFSKLKGSQWGKSSFKARKMLSYTVLHITTTTTTTPTAAAAAAEAATATTTTTTTPTTTTTTRSISLGVGLVCHPGLLALLLVISCGQKQIWTLRRKLSKTPASLPLWSYVSKHDEGGGGLGLGCHLRQSIGLVVFLKVKNIDCNKIASDCSCLFLLRRCSWTLKIALQQPKKNQTVRATRPFGQRCGLKKTKSWTENGGKTFCITYLAKMIF